MTASTATIPQVVLHLLQTRKGRALPVSNTRHSKKFGKMQRGMMQPSIILLKEGTDSSQGKAQLISNMNACAAVADIVRTTLGPRGMDKLIHNQGKVVISNDGATIMKNLEIVHPAAQTMVDIAKSQDSEVFFIQENFLFVAFV